jgi:hypothetical protein
MAWLGFMLGALGVLLLSYLLTASYMRRKHGVNVRYTGLLIMLLTVACFVPAFYVLRRFGFDLRRGQAREIFWLVLGVVWIVSSVSILYDRKRSGAVLMDLGPAPMSRLQIGLAVLLGVVAIGLAIGSGPHAQAFAYAAWSAWFFVMSRGRIEVRERGVILSGLLPWRRIAACAAASHNVVRLELTRGLQRIVDVSLPADRSDEFIHLVNAHKGVSPGSTDPSPGRA